MYTYLTINILSISIPLLLSFEKSLYFFKDWKYVFKAIFFTSVFFLIWDYYFTVKGIWSFNPEYISGLYLAKMPVEEWLFFICIPFACLFIYRNVQKYFSFLDYFKGYNYITAFLALFSLLMVILHHDKLYTVVNFSVLFVILSIFWLTNPKYMGAFYGMFVIHLIPFFIVNGFLTGLPVVTYDNSENLALRIGSIPFEDIFYSLSMMLMNVSLFEFFKRRKYKQYA
jgi:lycopene cyclase domain-containing protein